MDTLLVSPYGSTYAAGGTYTADLTTAAGCDSTATLQLTVVQLSANVIVDDPFLTAEETGASYQWIDCLLGDTPIPGATERTFLATQNGSYAVVITSQGCSVTSTCYDIFTTEVPGEVRATLRVSPVPTDGWVRVQGLEGPVLIELLDARGRIVQRTRTYGPSMDMDLSDVLPGSYFVRVIGEEGTQVVRIAVR